MGDVVDIGRSWFTAAAGDEEGVAEVVIYDEIGLWGITASDFHRSLRALGPVAQINLRINSPGGDVFDGLAIYNMLRRNKARVHVTIDGIAASMASVVAMAGDDVAMPENAMLMIHDPSGVVLGTSKEMRELADALDKVKSGLVSAYAAKSGAEADEIEKLMADETWLTADEAVELGLADRIEGAVQMAANFNLNARFRSVPEGLSARKPKEATMPNDEPTNAAETPETAAAPEAETEAVDGTEQESVEQPAPEIAASSDEPIKAERQRAADIIAACDVAGRPGDAGGFIAEGKSLSEVVATLQKARASAGASNEITARNGGGAQQPPMRVDLAADMRRRTGVAG